MKQISICIFLGILLSLGCTENTKMKVLEKKEFSPIGQTFIKIKDNKKGGMLGGLINLVSFEKHNCKFYYLGIPMSGTYDIENKTIFISTNSEIGNLTLTITDNNTLDGEGWIAGTFSNIYKYYITDKPIQKTIKVKRTISLRAGMGKEYTELSKINKGETIGLLEKNKNWSLVRYDSIEAYISNKYINQ